jgi:hypothetical protein
MRLAIWETSTRAYMDAAKQNRRFQELRDEAVMTERWPHRWRSRPDRLSSTQLFRWHIGQKRSNRLIESGAGALFSGYVFKTHGLLAKA